VPQFSSLLCSGAPANRPESWRRWRRQGCCVLHVLEATLRLPIYAQSPGRFVMGSSVRIPDPNSCTLQANVTDTARRLAARVSSSPCRSAIRNADQRHDIIGMEVYGWQRPMHKMPSISSRNHSKASWRTRRVMTKHHGLCATLCACQDQPRRDAWFGRSKADTTQTLSSGSVKRSTAYYALPLTAISLPSLNVVALSRGGSPIRRATRTRAASRRAVSAGHICLKGAGIRIRDAH